MEVWGVPKKTFCASHTHFQGGQPPFQNLLYYFIAAYKWFEARITERPLYWFLSFEYFAVVIFECMCLWDLLGFCRVFGTRVPRGSSPLGSWTLILCVRASFLCERSIIFMSIWLNQYLKTIEDVPDGFFMWNAAAKIGWYLREGFRSISTELVVKPIWFAALGWILAVIYTIPVRGSAALVLKSHANINFICSIRDDYLGLFIKTQHNLFHF